MYYHVALAVKKLHDYVNIANYELSVTCNCGPRNPSLTYSTMSSLVDLAEWRPSYRPQRSSGKVIFSQACVILFTGEGGGVSPIFQGGLQFFGGSPIFPGGPIFWGVSNFFFLFFQFFISPKFLLGCTKPPPPPRDGQCAGGTHPTGMHSCCLCEF